MAAQYGVMRPRVGRVGRTRRNNVVTSPPGHLIISDVSGRKKMSNKASWFHLNFQKDTDNS